MVVSISTLFVVALLLTTPSRYEAIKNDLQKDIKLRLLTSESEDLTTNATSQLYDDELLAPEKSANVQPCGNSTVISKLQLIGETFGSLQFLISDIVVTHLKNEELCYDEITLRYQSKGCPGSPLKPGQEPGNYRRNYSVGGRSYAFRLFSEDVIHWAPVIDNRNGTYSVSVRVEDPSWYTAEVSVLTESLNMSFGCAWVDCDFNNPSILDCRNYPISRKNTSAQTNHTRSTILATLAVNLLSRSNSYSVSQPLRHCTPQEIGTVRGRWINPNLLNYKYLNWPGLSPNPYPQSAFGYIWQPFDCFIPWKSMEDVVNCTSNYEFILVMGFSRERTNYFDILEFMGTNLDHDLRKRSKSMLDSINKRSMSFGNMYMTSSYWTELSDKKSWNTNHNLDETFREISNQILYDPKLTKSHRNHCKEGAKTALIITEEHLFMTAYGLNMMWKPAVKGLLTRVRKLCPTQTIIYKTGSHVATGKISWQRIWQQTRISARIAQELGMLVVDSFYHTAPLISSKIVFPDGLHLYTNQSWLGNNVSRTISMIMLNQLCPTVVNLT